MKTTIHVYRFDIRDAKQQAAWRALKETLKAGAGYGSPSCFSGLISVMVILAQWALGEMKMAYRVTYPLITTDAHRDFETRAEAEVFAAEKRNRTSQYLTAHSWRSVRVEEVKA